MRTLALLLPALIPSWRFFKTVAPSPRLEARRGDDWQPVPPPAMPLGVGAVLRRLVWNPEWNAHLYSVTLSERLLETGDARAAEALRDHVAGRMGWPPDETHFRLILVYRDGGRILRDLVYQSDGP